MQGVRKIQVTRENSDDENGEPLSPVARLCHEPGNNLYIIAIIGFKTKINPEVIKANLLRYAPENPRFSCLQVMDKNGVMRWVPTKGDINNHIIEPELNTSPSGDIVEDFIHNLTKSTIDNSKPLWDFHILNVKTSDAESTCIFRLHHSIGDGLSLMSLLLSFTWHQSLVPDQALATVDQAKKSTPKHISISLMKLFLKFLSIFVVAWNTMVDMVSYLASLWFLKDTKTPLSTPSTLNGSTGRRIVYKLVSLDDIKLVKNQMGVTVNDVVVGVTQGGLSLYLNNKYGGNNEKVDERSNHLPNNIRLRGCIMINMRLSQLIRDETKSNWGNKIGHVLFPLTIAIRDDPLDYVRDAKATMDRKKASLEAICTYLMAKFFLPIIGPKVVQAMSRITLWFSNIPGPREEKNVCGYPVSFLASGVYGQSIALVIHVTSYCNKMAFALSVEDNVVPNPYELLDAIEKSLNLIKDAAIAEKNTKKIV